MSGNNLTDHAKLRKNHQPTPRTPVNLPRQSGQQQSAASIEKQQ
jgi:hypothetical protein